MSTKPATLIDLAAHRCCDDCQHFEPGKDEKDHCGKTKKPARWYDATCKSFLGSKRK